MKARFATAWLDGCSGCHMSFLDIDEKLIELCDRIDLVYSPIVDIKEFPENVDVTLVEGTVNNAHNEERIRLIRSRTKTLVALGDCAVTGNVPSMRNSFPKDQVLKYAYVENSKYNPQIPKQNIPTLLPHAEPIHSRVKVDLYVPGCPPSADLIEYVVTELLEGRKPELASVARFGK